jgi:hypothetical protein
MGIYLKGSMLQVEYSSSFLLDVGWYPLFDFDGRFQIGVVKNDDWSDLLFFFGSDKSFFAKKGNG